MDNHGGFFGGGEGVADPKGALDGRFEIRSTGAGEVLAARSEPQLSPADFGALMAASAASASALSVGGAGGGGGGVGGASERKEEIERPLVTSTLSVAERAALILSCGEEVVVPSELEGLLSKKAHPICYDGFEPSGRMHIAQGILKSIIVNKLIDAGCIFKFWVADWFAMLNHKMGGDLKKIRIVGEYMIEVWRASGMRVDTANVQFLWASDEINKRPAEYWGRVMDIAMRFNLARIQRCCTIMGRKEADEMSASQIFYPAMQCADVFFLEADICQLGMDQRKVNMLAREYCDAARPKIKHKPIIVSHHMLAGLKEGQEKMSKSEPDTAIFMEDTAADVKRKIKRAFCPPGVVEGNPVLDWCRHIVFPRDGKLLITRKPENGGDKLYSTADELEADFAAGGLHPADLKAALTAALNAALQPVRDHFASGRPKELLEKVKRFRATR